MTEVQPASGLTDGSRVHDPLRALRRRSNFLLTTIAILAVSCELLTFSQITLRKDEMSLTEAAILHRIRNDGLQLEARGVGRIRAEQEVHPWEERFVRSLEEWNRSFDTLEQRSSSFLESGEINSIDSEVKPRHFALRGLFERLRESTSSSSNNHERLSNSRSIIQAVAEQQPAYLAALDNAVGKQVSESKAELDRLRLTTGALTLLLILMLIGSSVFVFGPALRKAQEAKEALEQEHEALVKNEDELGRHQAHLQKIVQERTIELGAALERLQLAVDAAEAGTGTWDVGTNLVYFDHRLEQMFGLSPGNPAITYAAAMERVHPDDIALLEVTLAKALGGNGRFTGEFRVKAPGGRFRTLSARGVTVQDADGRPERMTGLCQDITERRQSHEELERRVELRTAELIRSNRELEQFAYVASHDLQEPLRMVSSYLELLKQRYREHLDQDAQDFIKYAVDGSARMKCLIDDLLMYSRIGTRGKLFEPTDSLKVLEQALANLRIAIEESGAAISWDPLPIVHADDTQLIQLFQNLVGNAIKYRSSDIPTIKITVEQQNHSWLFRLTDNGIGIDPRYAERIFVIFQRLHTRSQYQGTGIGLAICKKIVERHGGRIWLDKSVEKGATFCFTLPRIEEAQPVLDTHAGTSREDPEEPTAPEQSQALSGTEGGHR